MSRLEELIQKLCPDGIEYLKVEEICNVTRGRVMSKEYLRNNIGEYPVYSSQTENDGELGKISTYDFDGEYLTWTTDGAHAGSVFYRYCKFSVTNVCGLLEIKDKHKNLTKYIYYILNAQVKKYVNKGMGNPKLMSNIMANIKIPLPPLKIQEEIVHILDSFTELTNELTNELTARRKQYEYYRDSLLLDLDNESEIIELNNVIVKVNNINWRTISDFNNYQYIDLSSVDINNKLINNTITISVDNHPSRAQQEVKVNDVIFGTTRPTQMRIAIIPPELNNQVCSTGYCVLRANIKRVLPKWIYYNLSTNRFRAYVEKFQQGASYPAISDTLIKKYTISIPPLDVQNKIINVLDNFKSLCNDIINGLPAEIEARKKQYEYYRDKLLTFKDITVNN